MKRVPKKKRALGKGSRRSRMTPPKELPTDPRELYVRTEVPLAEVVRQYKGRKGCSYNALLSRAHAEDWDGLRSKYQKAVVEKTLEKAASTESDLRARQLARFQRLEELADAELTNAEAALKILAKRRRLRVLRPEDLKSLTQTLELSSRAARLLVDTKDDRYRDLLAKAGTLAFDQITDIDDWNQDEEVLAAMTPKAMNDLAFQRAKPPAETAAAPATEGGST